MGFLDMALTFLRESADAGKLVGGVPAGRLLDTIATTGGYAAPVTEADCETSERGERTAPRQDADGEPSGAAWESCPSCGGSLSGLICWAEERRICEQCGDMFDGVLNRFCATCRFTSGRAHIG